jgi:hypothetical protein
VIEATDTYSTTTTTTTTKKISQDAKILIKILCGI